MKLLLIIFFSTFQAFGGNSFENFLSQGTPLDLNNDGVGDLVKRKIAGGEEVVSFNPSWDLSFQKMTVIRPHKTDIKKFRKGNLIHHLVEIKSVDTNRIIETVEYSNYTNGKALKKVKTLWRLEEKEITHYQKVNDKWVEGKKLKESIDLFYQGAEGCQTNIFPLSEPERGILGSIYNFLNFSRNLHLTTIGLRIDSESCSEEAISQFDAAIGTILNQYLPCLSSKRPALAERIITGLQANQNRVYCERGRGGREAAYTYSRPDADIIFSHHTRNGFNHSPEFLANILFHEILHHHFETDRRFHNHGDVIDPVYGCTSLCSGFEADDIMNMDPEIFRGFSVKGCELCLISPFLDGSQDGVQGEVANPNQFECRENSIISLLNRCKSLLGESECRNKNSVAKVSHPNFQKCLERGVEANDCLWLDIYNSESNFESFVQFFDHPNFGLCLSKVRHQSQCMRDIQHLNLFNDPDVLRCIEFAPKNDITSCFNETLRSEILSRAQNL